MRTQTFLLEFNKPQILLIPENCAHGFQTLESNCKIYIFIQIIIFLSFHKVFIIVTHPSILIGHLNQRTFQKTHLTSLLTDRNIEEYKMKCRSCDEKNCN